MAEKSPRELALAKALGELTFLEMQDIAEDFCACLQSNRGPVVSVTAMANSLADWAEEIVRG